MEYIHDDIQIDSNGKFGYTRGSTTAGGQHIIFMGGTFNSNGTATGSITYISSGINQERFWVARPVE